MPRDEGGRAVRRGRVLVIDDEEDIRESIAERLEMEGFETLLAESGREGLERIRAEAPDLVLLDLMMPDMDGLAVLRALAVEGLDPTVVVVTAHGTIARAVEAMRAGAYDFIPKPFSPDHIRAVVGKALEREGLRRENAALRQQLGSAPELVAEDPRMREALRVARRVADSRATILLRGESGTGKEVFARAIHAWSPRRERPFVALNCMALAEGLLESELFGHEKGAFTGADQRRSGRFEMARDGTLLLDEIGPTRLEFQAKLLRVLQEGTFERVGGSQALRVDVRVIAATNRDLEAGIRDGTFLQDLYYRLNVVSIEVPALRDRKADIVPLARHFLTKYAHEAKRDVVGLSAEAAAYLQAYDWPGNVRELENAIERAVVLGVDEEIGAADLPEQVLTAGAGAVEGGGAGFHAEVEEYRRKLIREALECSGGNRTRAAAALGLQRTYLAKLIRNLGLG